MELNGNGHVGCRQHRGCPAIFRQGNPFLSKDVKYASIKSSKDAKEEGFDK